MKTHNRSVLVQAREIRPPTCRSRRLSTPLAPLRGRAFEPSFESFSTWYLCTKTAPSLNATTPTPAFNISTQCAVARSPEGSFVALSTAQARAPCLMRPSASSTSSTTFASEKGRPATEQTSSQDTFSFSVFRPGGSSRLVNPHISKQNEAS